jgi:hypothetical protein
MDYSHDFERDRMAGALFHTLRAMHKPATRQTNADARFQARIEAHVREMRLELSEARKVEWLAARDDYERSLG